MEEVSEGLVGPSEAEESVAHEKKYDEEYECENKVSDYIPG